MARPEIRSGNGTSRRTATPLRDTMDTKSGFIRSSAWMLVSRVLQQVLLFGRLALLSRLLDPADFGLMGVALLTMATLEVLTITGFQEALVQRGDRMEGYLGTAWTVLVLRSFLIYGVLFAAAPWFALFFEAPGATDLVRVAGLSVIAYGFRNIRLVRLQADLRYGKVFAVEMASLAAEVLVSIAWAVASPTAWALVAGVIAGKVVYSIASYAVDPALPAVGLDMARVRELFRYGRWLLGSSVMIYCYTQMDSVIVGRVMGTAALGIYLIGQRMSLLPYRQFSSVIAQVAFPAFSRLKDDREALRRAYRRIVSVNCLFIMPVTFAVLAHTRDIVILFLGAKWESAVPVVTVFSLMALLSAMNTTSGALFNAVGLPRLSVTAQGIKMAVLFASIFLLLPRMGLAGAPAAALLGEIVTTPYILRQLRRTSGFGFRDLLVSAGVPFAAAGYSFFLPMLARDLFVSIAGVPASLVILLVGGSLLYLGLIRHLDAAQIYTGYGDFREVRETLLRRRPAGT